MHKLARGLKRNQEIIDLADEVVGFWNKMSEGTGHSLELARKKGMPVTIVTFL